MPYIEGNCSKSRNGRNPQLKREIALIADKSGMTIRHHSAIHMFSEHLPLHLAAVNGNLLTMQVLVDLGANPNAQYINQRIPLHFAAVKDQAGVVHQPTEAEAKPNTPDRNGLTPPDAAVSAGFEGNLRILQAATLN